MKNVALYIRVSTDRQAKEGDSLEAQEAALRKYATENNYIIYDTYIDGGESGQKLNRTNLTRMLDDVRDGKIDLIVMTKLDRWFRSVADFYEVNKIIKKYKVNWKTIWEDYDTSTASGSFWLNVSLALGEMEAKRTSERISAVFDYKLRIQKKTCSGKVPYGYRIDEDKKLVIDEKQANHIKELFDYYIKSNNLRDTTNWFQLNCKMIGCETVKKYLKNTVYIGKYKRYRKNEYIDDFAPPIIDVNVFNTVKTLLEKNIKKYSKKNTNDKKEYTFNGLLRCGKCGKKMWARWSGNKNNHYYRCKSYTVDKLCSNNMNVSSTNIERYLEKEILKYINGKMPVEKITNRKETKDNTPVIKQKLNKLVELYMENLIDKEYYKKEYERLNDLIEKEIQPIKTINTNKIQKILDNNFFELYNGLSNFDKRRLLASFIDYIEVKGKNDFEIHFL